MREMSEMTGLPLRGGGLRRKQREAVTHGRTFPSDPARRRLRRGLKITWCPAACPIWAALPKGAGSMGPEQLLCAWSQPQPPHGQDGDLGTSTASTQPHEWMQLGSPDRTALPPASIRACTNPLDRSALQFRGQKFRRGFIACFLGATTAKCLRSSPG